MGSYPALVWLTWLMVYAVILVVAIVVVGICGLVASGLSAGDRPTRAGERGSDRGAGRRFADLIANGDFEAAEAAAEQAFARAHRPQVIEWNERAVVALSFDEARRELTEPEFAATWFPGVRPMLPGEVGEIDLGGADPIHLRMVSGPWSPDLDGVTFEAWGDAFSIQGSLSLRTVLTGIDPFLRTATEVLVHMQSTDAPGVRRALARARAITREGLSRLAAVYKVASA